MRKQQIPVGGGFKKVLYTLNSVKRIGLIKSAKALTANNTCKACGLGMGGQHGGMTNELDEFPSVCNKSIQAQLTDIQPAIPEEIFQHSFNDFKELRAQEIESLGRLNTPLYKAKNTNKFETISWEQALEKTVQRFSATQPSRSFFYSSGRSSNEAGFLLQLVARMYGSNHINNCSYYCHQATSVGLSSAIGSGTATVELADLALADLIFIIGANPASNHPRLIHQLKNCRDRDGNIVVINPAKEAGLVRFAVPKSPKSMLSGGDWIASEYLQPNIGSDLALLKGIAKSLIENKQIDQTYIEKYTTGFADYLKDIESTPWLLIESSTGINKAEIKKVAELYANSSNTVFAWGMGITHHENGVENVEAIASLALLRGMIGKPGAGLLPLRGHSNVQGIGTVGVKPVLAEDVFNKIEKEFGITLSRAQGMDTLACLQAAEKNNIDSALIMGGNLYAGSPDSSKTNTSLNAIGFKCFLTTTLNHGHIYGSENSETIIFPVTARDEEWQSTTQESMFSFVRLSDGGITRLDNVRPEVTILADIASGLMKDSPIDFSEFKQHQKIRETIAKVIPNMEELKDISIAKKEFHIRGRIKHTPEFSTSDNKAHFIVNPLPQCKIPTENNHFMLMSVRSEGQFNSIIYEELDSYRKIPQRWSVLMNADDMLSLGLKHEDKVTLKTKVGEMKNLKVYAFDLPRKNIMVYYPEANVLIDQTVDPRSRTPAFKSVQVKLIV